MVELLLQALGVLLSSQWASTVPISAPAIAVPVTAAATTPAEATTVPAATTAGR